MKTVNIQYLYFDDKVCGRCKEEQQASHCEDCSCLTGEDVSCRSYGKSEQLTKDQILTALKKVATLSQ